MLYKFSCIINFIFFISSPIYAQFFVKEPYIGGLANPEWTNNWTEFAPEQAEYKSDNVKTIEGFISTNTKWVRANTYLIKGQVYVSNQATLYIEPGTIIKGDFATKGTLIVTQGSRIHAAGSETRPIIFTSSQAANNRRNGDWGGLVIMGRSLVNTKTGKQTIAALTNKNFNTYGGDIPNDDSGILKYVRIEFAGAKLINNTALNGLALAGVGKETEIDYVQISHSQEDSYELYGGTAQLKHVISYKSYEDDFDMHFGYNGNLQFGLVYRLKLKDYIQGYGVEATSYDQFENFNMKDFTSAKLSNFTFITQEEQKSEKTPIFKPCVHLSKNVKFEMHNSIVLGGFSSAIHFETQDLEKPIESKEILMTYNTFMGCFAAISKGINVKKDFNTWFIDQTPSNKYFKSHESIIVEDAFGNIPKFKTIDNNLSSSANYDWLDKKDEFGIEQKIEFKALKYESAKFIGAFGSQNWMEGWTNFDPQNSDYPIENTVYITDPIAFNTIWTNNNTYILMGQIDVMNSAILTIQPGTVIKGDYDTKASLVIRPDSRINAVGTVDEPIIFTSTQSIGNRKAGDWAGIIIAGNDKVNTTDFKMNYTDVKTEFIFGGTAAEDYSGSFKYVRIEFAGAKTKNENVSGLTFAGVKSINLSHVQVSNCLGTSFEWLGGRCGGKNLVSYHCNDDDFSANYGFGGFVQYALCVRNPLLADAGKANAIESIGTLDEKVNQSPTKGIFSNITIIGPIKNKTTQFNQNYHAAIHIAKNSALSVYNSIVTGFPKGLFIDGLKSEFNASAKILNFKGNAFANIPEPLSISVKSTWAIKAWFDGNNNKVFETLDDIKFKDAFSDSPNPSISNDSKTYTIKSEIFIPAQ